MRWWPATSIWKQQYSTLTLDLLVDPLLQWWLPLSRWSRHGERTLGGVAGPVVVGVSGCICFRRRREGLDGLLPAVLRCEGVGREAGGVVEAEDDSWRGWARVLGEDCGDGVVAKGRGGVRRD